MNLRLKPFFVVFFIFLSFSSFAGGKRDKLFTAVETGTEKEIKKIVRKYPECIDVKRSPGKESLLMAALKEDRELSVIKFLLKYDADPMQKDSQKRNSIMYAAKYSSDPEVLEAVIKAGAFFNFFRARNILKTDKDGKNSFDYARENSDSEKMLAVLQKYAAEKQPQDDVAETEETSEAGEEGQEQPQEDAPLPDSQAEGQNNLTEQTAVSAPAPLVPPAVSAATAAAVVPAVIPLADSEDGQTKTENSVPAQQQTEDALPPSAAPSATAVQTSPLPAVPVTAVPYTKTYLFDYAEDGSTAEVPQESDDDVFHTFIENADSRDLNGRTKLMTACKKGNLELAENLIYSGADVNATDDDGWTPLMFASRFTDNVKIVKTLIQNGAKVQQKNNYGVTPLKLAAGFSSSPAIVQELLNSYSATDAEARAAFIYAVSSSAPVSILEVFYKKELSLNASYDGKTPLMYAAESNKDTKTLEWLLKNGAKKTYRTKSGLTAFDFAKENKMLPHDGIYWSLKLN